MDPLLLQQQLKNNNKDLMDFCQDLKSWGEEMQKKEQGKQPENKEKPKEIPKETSKVEEVQAPKKKCMSYADWDKYDAEKECEKVDEDSDSELTDEYDESSKEEALLQKEKGNKFVKAANWDEAIKCYTKAIDYYAYDPVFHANRALCYLKKQDAVKAEKDCTVSLKLDHTYVKAYQRRAAARESLGRLKDAKLDLMRVLELEPKNAESLSNLERLKGKMKQAEVSEAPNEPQRTVSKFTASRQMKKGVPPNNSPTNVIKNVGEKVDLAKPVTFWPSGDQTNLVRAINKPPHLRSKKPLKRISVQEISDLTPTSPVTSFPKENSKSHTIHSDDLKIVEHKLTELGSSSEKEMKNLNNLDTAAKVKEVEDLEIPKNSVQFHMRWKMLKGRNDEKYKYLKLLQPEDVPRIFKDSLESEIFSEILQILSDYFVRNLQNVYNYLFYFTQTKRFKALTMFLTLNDKNCLWKMFNHMKENEGRSKDEIDMLIKEYEL